ncbi:hypothetical protein FQN54_000331 [Arachnomyces sp. PD_36]|nr:hypothetical protein FQN54_000331 [Arachnomyces sp. PD_36]
MSHTASKTWVSDETKEHETFVKVRDTMSHVVPRSPFVPWTFTEWVAHRLATKEDAHKDVVRQIENKLSGGKKFKRIPLDPAMGGKAFDDHLACVLARESIWTPSDSPIPGRPAAPWPTYEEFKHEGDDRNKSGFSRFPPLPRDPGNATVNWKQRSPLTQLSFDETGKPTMAGEEAPLGMEDQMLVLIGNELLRELDE